MNGRNGVFRPVVPVKLINGDKVVHTHCMLDNGANVDIIRSDVVDRLGLRTTKIQSRLTTVDCNSAICRPVTGEITLGNFCDDQKVKIESAMVFDILTTDDDVPPTNKEIEGYEYMEGVHFTELGDKSIGMILSAEHMGWWTGGEARRSTDDKPVASYTWFGWTLGGVRGTNPSASRSCFRTTVDNKSLHDDIQRLFRQDFRCKLTMWRVRYAGGIPRWGLSY